jgi:hypothetical protein
MNTIFQIQIPLAISHQARSFVGPKPPMPEATRPFFVVSVGIVEVQQAVLKEPICPHQGGACDTLPSGDFIIVFIADWTLHF